MADAEQDASEAAETMAESARIMESVKKETASDDKDLSPDGLAYNVSSFELEVERCVAFAICDLDGLGATEERGGPRVRAVLRACKLHRWEPLGKCWPAPMRIGGAAQARQLRSVASGRAASSGVTRGGWQGCFLGLLGTPSIHDCLGRLCGRFLEVDSWNAENGIHVTDEVEEKLVEEMKAAQAAGDERRDKIKKNFEHAATSLEDAEVRVGALGCH